MFKTPKEWLTFVTGKKFVRSDNAAIYQFINPMLNGGFNLKVLWKGKMINTKAEFHTLGNPVLKIEEEVFTITALTIESGEEAGKDLFTTPHRGKEVTFRKL